MKTPSRTLTLLAVLGLFCSFAYAMPVRETFSLDITLCIDENGNLGRCSSEVNVEVKAVKFPRSGIIINRLKSKNVTNLSGKRIVFRNFGLLFPVFDPESTSDVISPTRNRFTFPKGLNRKMNLVTMRGINVANPNKPRIIPPR